MKKLIIAVVMALTVLGGTVAISVVSSTPVVAGCTSSHYGTPNLERRLTDAERDALKDFMAARIAVISTPATGPSLHGKSTVQFPVSPPL
jgi:hypothetical protein